MGNLSSLLRDQTSRMPVIPTYLNIRTFSHSTTLGIYHFRGRTITLEKRKPAVLEEGEGELQETVITLMEPHSPCVEVALAFEFPEHLRLLFIRLANICKGGTMEQVESIDTEIQPQIGVSLLSDRLILEALVCLTIALRNFPLVKALTASGSPSPEEETRFLWNWREAITKADGICDSSTTTVLLRHRWLKMKDAYADQIPTILDEEMVIDRIDALLEVGYSFIPAPTDPLQAKYYHLLLQEISHERIPILRHLLSRAPIPNTVSMYNSLLTEAASRVKDGVAIIELLLEQGLDIDGRQQSTDGSYDTTLHVAIRVGCIQNVECLLRHGARMLQDAGGRMPLELAEHLHHSEIVRVLKYHLQMNE